MKSCHFCFRFVFDKYCCFVLKRRLFLFGDARNSGKLIQRRRNIFLSVRFRESGDEAFLDDFSDMLLLKLLDVATRRAYDNDKVKSNAVRALGNLLRYLPQRSYSEPFHERLLFESQQKSDWWSFIDKDCLGLCRQQQIC